MLLNYRKDIDGLRAVAVMMVVLFHIGFPITGGFVGVDIFFVISGFLIASLIQKQILRDKFTFKGFYLHRMRRILPALIFVILITLLMAWFILLPEGFHFFVSSIIYSLVGFSNLYFYGKGQDYFAAETDQITLLHTWSLGVEEQFYFIAPIFLILLFKFAYKTKWFNIILIGFTFIGLGLSHYYAVNNPAGAYYLLPARFFELLMGVVLALNYNKLPIIKTKITANLLAVIALLLLVLPSLLITKESVFPSYNAFIVCLGACLVIYLGKLEEKTFLTKILSLKPIVFIGLISYSLYLWHWPITSFINTVGISLSSIEKLGFVLLFILLAYISWKFVEQPFRNKFKWGFIKTFIILLLIPAVFAQLLKDFSKDTDGLMNYRFKGESLNMVSSSQKDLSKIKKYCHGNYKKDWDTGCEIGDVNAEVTTLVFGDSHMNSMAKALDILLLDVGIKAKILTDNSTLYLKGLKKESLGLEGSAISKEDAENFVAKIDKEIMIGNYQNIILGGFYKNSLNYYGKENFYIMLSETIKQIQSTGANVYIIKDIAAVGSENVNCGMFNKIFSFRRTCSVDKKYVLNSQKETYAFSKIMKEFDDIKFIDPKDILCDKSKCKTYLDSISFYRDGTHLSYAGSEYVGNEYLAKYGNPFKQ